jgi:cytochrome P450
VTLARNIRANPHWLPRNPRNTLSDVPGEDGWPIVGTTLKLLRDPPGFVRRMHHTYGQVYRSNSFGGRLVTLIGPDANELVMLDRDKLFSHEQGWGSMMDMLFPRGLMMMDFEKHRMHRRTLSVAFKPEPMRIYADAMNANIGQRVAEWRQGDFKFYPSMKQLSLDLAATSFLGIPWGGEARAINKAFNDMVTAIIAPVRVPLPGTAMRRGIKGRKVLVDHFRREIPARRVGDGQDMFSQICRSQNDDGTMLTDDEIIDHMNFMLMAAHDTTSSTVTTMAMLLGQHPEWQDRLRDEMLGLGLNGDALPYDRLNDLVLTEYVLKETLRLMPPLPFLPRRALRAFSFGGYDFPAGTFIGIQPAYTHRMPEHWPEPDKFDPMRFEPEAVRQRHKYAWVPFGGGAHMCLGLHFSYLQAKILFYHLLLRNRIELMPSTGKWMTWPVPKPLDGLPMRLVPV